jgi:hypothetical protein
MDKLVTKSLHTLIRSCGVTFDMSLNAPSLQKVGLHKEIHSTVYPSSRCQHGNHALSSQLTKAEQVFRAEEIKLGH